MPFETLDHTADAAVRVTAANEAELFREAAAALYSIILDRGASGPIEAREEVAVRLEAEDGEALLVDWLSELIFLFDTRRFLARDVPAIAVRLGRPARLEATLAGEALDRARHAARTEVKAATFHEMEIRKTASGLEAVIVFDL